MFYECSSLEKINLSNIDITNLTNMQLIFAYCPSLKEIKIPKLNISNVKDKGSMFYGCSDDFIMSIKSLIID